MTRAQLIRDTRRLIAEGLPETKQRELAEVLKEAGIYCRIVAPADAQKKSLAMESVLEMMLLAPEA